ncbi:hypothetical protein [Nocardia lijiangensis]|uniref:hypothetical protein n=1 Tax=Nocardia lijiangensis TaxID=299618 RepID=UPI003D727193
MRWRPRWPPRRRPAGKLLAEVAAYAGAGLLLGGLVLFLEASWVDLAQASRVAILAILAVMAIGGAGAVALAIAEAASEWNDGMGAAGFVLIVGAVLLAAGVIALARSPRGSD